MRIGGRIGYRLLRWLSRGPKAEAGSEAASSYVPKIQRIIGSKGWDELRDRTVLDFGCGTGAGAVEMARHGARRVIGLDIREEVLEVARRRAEECGVAGSCVFTRTAAEPVDVIVSVDAFEHFADPAAVLKTMCSLLRDDGFVLVSFGPPWYHPRGGHLFSVFPWSHLLFTEEAQLRWRADFKSDGARRFHEIAGGLNMMSVGRFVSRVNASGLRFEQFRAVPIRPLRWAHNRLTREFTTSVVECKLVKRRPVSAP